MLVQVDDYLKFKKQNFSTSYPIRLNFIWCLTKTGKGGVQRVCLNFSLVSYRPSIESQHPQMKKICLFPSSLIIITSKPSQRNPRLSGSF